jgi:hypothetical protein
LSTSACTLNPTRYDFTGTTYNGIFADFFHSKEGTADAEDIANLELVADNHLLQLDLGALVGGGTMIYFLLGAPLQLELRFLPAIELSSDTTATGFLGLSEVLGLISAVSQVVLIVTDGFPHEGTLEDGRVDDRLSVRLGDIILGGEDDPVCGEELYERVIAFVSEVFTGYGLRVDELLYHPVSTRLIEL